VDRYAAFLRGVNLGKARRVTGAQLCAVATGAGLRDVGSFLSSGNLAFSTDAAQPPAALEERIEAALEAALGFPVPTLVRGAAELAAIVARKPFTPEELERSSGRPQVVLLRSAPGPQDAAAVLAHTSAEDRLVLEGRELHWLPAGGMSASRLDLDALLGRLPTATIRTANTLAHLQAKLLTSAS
jgi:uncharacterized protein (DUF1697 family)